MRKLAALLTVIAAVVAAMAIPAAADRPDVVVVDGTDRYDTAAQLALSDGTSASTLYIANGEKFVDAVAAGVHADDGDKILLVKRDEVPRPTAAALRKIHRNRVVFLGGDDVISPQVRDTVQQMVPICAGDRDCW